MGWNMNHIDRRRFLRGSGVALALPMFGSLSISSAREPRSCWRIQSGLAASISQMAFQCHCRKTLPIRTWAWFPHGNGSEFTFTKCMEPLEPLKGDLTVLSGFSHPKSRDVHGHNNADQFLTAAATGGGDREYQNTISLDQEYAKHVG